MKPDWWESEFELDHEALQAYARGLGLKFPVSFRRGEVPSHSSDQAILQDTDGGKIQGRYAKRELITIEGSWLRSRKKKKTLMGHVVYVLDGLNARHTCEVIRHELQHAIQEEEGRGQKFAYKSFDEYTHASVEVEAQDVERLEWRDLGHCLVSSAVAT